jgi:hypothetical protein
MACSYALMALLGQPVRRSKSARAAGSRWDPVETPLAATASRRLRPAIGRRPRPRRGEDLGVHEDLGVAGDGRLSRAGIMTGHRPAGVSRGTGHRVSRDFAVSTSVRAPARSACTWRAVRGGSAVAGSSADAGEVSPAAAGTSPTSCRIHRIRSLAASGWSPNSCAIRPTQPQMPNCRKVRLTASATASAAGASDR